MFQIGKQYKILSLEELRNIGSEDSEGDIISDDWNCCFIRGMEHLCNTIITVTEIDDEDDVIIVDSYGDSWGLSFGMCKEVQDKRAILRKTIRRSRI